MCNSAGVSDAPNDKGPESAPGPASDPGGWPTAEELEKCHKAEQKAATEVKALAEKGDLESQYKLGALYRDGRGVDLNYQQAFKWLRRAAERGHSEAQFWLGQMYLGEGVRKDSLEAVRWHRKAAESGLAVAKAILGLLYMQGAEVPGDNVQAFHWSRRAAEKGHPIGQFNLASMYGSGPEQDLVEAYAWYSIAAVQDELAPLQAEATSFRDEIERALTPDELKRARQRARKLYAYLSANRDLRKQ